MAVVESWSRIEAWLAAHAPGIRGSLRSPAGDAALGTLGGKLGAELPADFAESTRVHDGQEDDAEHGLFPVSAGVLGPGPSFRLMTTVEIARAWAMMKDLIDGGEFTGATARPARGVRPDWWNTGWVPIAEDGGGDYVCLDLAPADGGVAGQVIVAFNDMADRPRLARSLDAWLETLAAGLASGQYALGAGKGIVEA